MSADEGRATGPVVAIVGATGAVDQGGAHQRDPVRLLLAAGEQKAQPEDCGRAVHGKAHSARGWVAEPGPRALAHAKS